MPTIRFTGRVLPTALNVSIPNEPTFKWTVDEVGLDVSFRVRIRDGLIFVDCELSKFDASYVIPLLLRAHDIARTCVALAAFSTGNGLTTVMEEFIDPTGAKTQLAAQHSSLAAFTAVRLGSQDFDKILKIVLAEPDLSIALRALIDAIALPHRAAINCARALDALGPIFRKSAGSPERAWLMLRDNLQISKSYVQKITQHPSARGSGDHTQGSDPTDIVDRTWTVMNRLFEYLKRGGQPLPLSEFPLLV